MIDRTTFDRGMLLALLALAAQLLFGAVAIQPGLAAVEASPLCTHAVHGAPAHQRNGAPPAQAISPLLVTLTIPMATQPGSPPLPRPAVGTKLIRALISHDAVPHARVPGLYRARAPPIIS